MDAIALAARMKRLHARLDRQCQPGRLVQRRFDRAPLGESYITIDPERQGPTASFNMNRVYICGAEPGLQREGLTQLVDLFRGAGVQRFFAWLSPGPDMDRVRGWLADAGFALNRWVQYPTLVRQSDPTIEVAADLIAREVAAEEVAAARDQLGEVTWWPEFERSAGREGCHHFMAFDGARPVAGAMLFVDDDIGYLTAASTGEGDRRRGAQQALIVARVAKARRIGCSTLVWETLSMLEQSLRNLERAGFRTVYDKEVYVWNANAAE